MNSCPLSVFRRRSCFHSLHFRVMLCTDVPSLVECGVLLEPSKAMKADPIEKRIYGQRGREEDKACIARGRCRKGGAKKQGSERAEWRTRIQ